MPYAARLVITHVDEAPPGTVTFPEIDPGEWEETARDDRVGFSIVTYERHR